VSYAACYRKPRMCFAMAFSDAVAEGKTLKRQHSRGLLSNEAENDTEESEGTSEIETRKMSPVIIAAEARTMASWDAARLRAPWLAQ
jgi:hypothetical protein